MWQKPKIYVRGLDVRVLAWSNVKNQPEAEVDTCKVRIGVELDSRPDEFVCVEKALDGGATKTH